MCNPRRVRVQATRKIAEAWRAEIEQAATARGDVSSKAQLVQSISDLLPPRARLAFEQAIRVSSAWDWEGGEYRQAVPGGYVAYRPDTGELEIVIEMKVALEAVGTASLVASGEVTAEVSAEGTGKYYDDGWGGHTEARARARAQAEADAKADKLAAKRREALKFQAEESARHELNQRTEEAAREARLTAERQLTLQAAELRPDLDQRAQQQLEAVQAQTLNGVFQLVAQGYSAALQAYAAENGENLRVSEEDGIIEIQFEVER